VRARVDGRSHHGRADDERGCTMTARRAGRRANRCPGNRARSDPKNFEGEFSASGFACDRRIEIGR
jgi:hypothetical protein